MNTAVLIPKRIFRCVFKTTLWGSTVAFVSLNGLPLGLLWGHKGKYRQAPRTMTTESRHLCSS
jgi:hypothetical protein